MDRTFSCNSRKRIKSQNNNMKKALLFFLLSSFFLVTNAQNQAMESLDFVKKLSKETTQYLSNADFATAADYIKPFWPMPEDEFKRFQAQATKSFKYITEGMGSSIGYVKIKEQTLGDIVFREVYFIQYKESPLRVEYIYYKTEKGWVINNIKWDADFELEFD